MTTADALVRGDTLRVVGHGSRWDGLEGTVQRIRPLRDRPGYPDAMVTLRFDREAVRAHGLLIAAPESETVDAAFVIAHLEPVQEES